MEEGFISQDDTEAVLKRVMDDGSFDKIRHLVLDQIKQNKELVSKSEQLVRGSKALSASGAGARTKKDLFEAIRREVEEEVLNEAVKAAWEILTTPTSQVSELIDRHAHEALCDIYESRTEQMYGQARPQT